ncbi:MAG: hypothetical protein WC551_07900 [Patescibacteria group bacterium]
MSFNMKEATLEQIVAEALALRAKAERSAAEYLAFLYQFELEREDLWKTAGVATYSQFLNSHSLVNTSRYDVFRKGVEKLGSVAQAIEIGEPSTAEAGKIKDPLAVPVFEGITKAWIDIHDGTVPSEQTAECHRAQAEPKKSPVFFRQSELHELRAKVQQLAARNRQLEADLRTKQKTIYELQAKLEGIAAKKAAKRAARVENSEGASV